MIIKIANADIIRYDWPLLTFSFTQLHRPTTRWIQLKADMLTDKSSESLTKAEDKPLKEKFRLLFCFFFRR
jgi:hypothetical protein